LSGHVQQTVQTFKPNALSNITWAFAMVQYRDEPLLRLVAPMIARDAPELKPLSLTRCAWAYRILYVHSPELTGAICSEALKKLDEFATKALVKLIDSVYVCPTVQQYSALEDALSERTEACAKFFKRSFPDAASLNGDKSAYTLGLETMGLVDCGFSGTPLLLEHLEIPLPGRDFMLQCRRQSWEDEEENLKPPKPDSSDAVATVAVECNLLFEEQAEHRWFVRYSGSDDVASSSTGLLTPVELPGRIAQQDNGIFVLLVEVCSVISNMGVNLESPEACEKVTGSTKIYTIQTPCLSSIGVLWQFKVRFPGILLEFADEVRASGSE